MEREEAKEFWKKVLIASIEAGKTYGVSVQLADMAVEDLRNSVKDNKFHP